MVQYLLSDGNGVPHRWNFLRRGTRSQQSNKRVEPENLLSLPLPSGDDSAQRPALFCPSGTSSTSCSTTQIPNNWYFDRVNAARIAHVLFSATADDINTVIAKSRSSYGSPGFLYIHDQDCDAVHGAVYSRLPTFF